MERIILFSLSLILSACTKGIPEFFELNPTQTSNDPNNSNAPDNSSTPTPTDVEPLQKSAPNWNDYFVAPIALRDSPSFIDEANACNPNALDANEICLHGGPLKKVVTNFSTCEDLNFHDYLDVFKWVCHVEGEVGSSAAVIYSLGFKANKSLFDLINMTVGPSWRENYLVVYHSTNRNSYITQSKVWWTNPISPLPTGQPSIVSLNQESYIYFVNGNANSSGFKIDADKISIIGNPSYPTLFSSGSSNCDPTFAATITHKCALVANGKNFLWLELSLKSLEMEFGLSLNNLKFSNFKNIKISSFKNQSINLKNSSYNIFNDVITSSTNGALNAYGFYIENSSMNRFYNITSANNKTNGFELTNSSNQNIVYNLKSYNNGDKGLMINNSSNNNIVSRALITNNNQLGIKFKYSIDNTLSHATIANNNGPGVIFESSGSTKTALTQIISSFNLSHGIDFGYTFDNFSAQIVVTNNGDPLTNNGSGLYMLGADSNNNIFHENLIVGSNVLKDCEIDTASSTGLQDSSCTTSGNDSSSDYPAGSNTHARLLIGKDLTTQFEGKVSTQDTSNQSNSLGLISFASLTDWIFFDNPFRTWGLYYSIWNKTAFGQCTANSGPCNIMDWRLKSSDLQLYNKSNDGVNASTFINGSACLRSCNGKSLSLRITLINATEIIGDNLGK
ncbi:MAG: right-handed parallel beta-helix repeat-containing protein [Bdellovibrionaceae bacterium]|nr:right-handed parallel beta-helix repeat-containing protein [Pseudobdellovibrionaceae bacterium]